MAQRDEIVANVRACLVSMKGKMDIRQLNRDYYKLMGSDIQWKALGHRSLEDFLKSVPTLSISRSLDGTVLVDAQMSEKSSHISEMVSRQKTATKKKSNNFKFVPRNNYNRFSLPGNHQIILNNNSQNSGKWRPKNTNQKWQVNYPPAKNPPQFQQPQRIVNKPPNLNLKPTSPPLSQRPPLQQVHPPPNANNNDSAKQPKQASKEPKQASKEPKQASKEQKSASLLRQLSNNNMVEAPQMNGHGKNHTPAASGHTSSKLPNSTKTNRAVIMQKTASPVHSPTFMENLKNEALAAVDPTSSIWSAWPSSGSESDGSPEKVFTPTGDSVVDLFNFAKFRRISEPLYKSIQHQAKPHKPKQFVCQIKIDGQAFTSYPEDCFDEVSAKYHVSKTTLQKLIDKYGMKKRQSLLLSNELDIVERVPPMVQEHTNGVWSYQIEVDYREKYREELALNWLDVINTSPNISIEEFDKKMLLRYCRPEDLLQKGKLSVEPLSSEQVVPTLTKVDLDKESLEAEIMFANSVKEIWCRLVDSPISEAYTEMLSKMKAFYDRDKAETNAYKTPFVVNGCFYVARYEDSWFRVRALEEKDNKIKCLLVDYGSDPWIPLENNFYQLQWDFAKVPGQVFICRLIGLEELYEVNVNPEFLSLYNGSRVIIEPHFEDEDNGKVLSSDLLVMLGSFAENKTGYLIVPSVMITKDSEININNELLDEIILQNATPSLDQTVNEVYVSHVEPEGFIYIQNRSVGYYKLMASLKLLEESIIAGKITNSAKLVTPENSDQRLYFTKTAEDKNYSRVRIVDWSPDCRFAQIQYCETGSTAVIRLQDTVLYPLDEISGFISRFPEQAFRVKPEVDAVADDFVEQVRALIPNDSSVLLRIVETNSEEDVPLVKLFVRVENMKLVSINESINIQLHQVKEANKVDKLEKLNLFEQDLKNLPSSGLLKCPTIPSVSSYLDVKVPLAVNPWNFFVQPYDFNEQLSELMSNLQDSCVALPEYSSVKIEDVSAGKIFASKYIDKKWYRTSIIKVINPHSISVFYCDFGNYANLKLSQLHPIDPKYLELPYQAIKAKLGGIKPKQEKWTMDDCKYFQKLVLRNTFVSIITSIEKDELYRADTVLGLKLIDTSTDTDVYIENLLVQKNIAIKI